MNEKSKVLEILKTVKPSVNLENVQDIVEGGYLDSLELLALITALSEQFGIEIGFEFISPENFNSVEAITMMVERLKK